MKPFDTEEIRFLLYDVAGADRFFQVPRYAHLDRETVDGVLDSAAAIAERYFVPHYRVSDACEPEVVEGRVALPPEVAQACRAYVDAGFMSVQQGLDEGGMQLPWSAAMGVAALFQASNISTQAFLTLTSAAGNLLAAHGSDEQKRRYLKPMREGRFFGTMALSEPQAGSSLADIRTTATPNDDGSYALTGTKQWISGGEHELAENIVHLVLAKIKGAPAGVRGISLFIVPRYRVNDDGSPGEDNNVRLVSLLHKMGYRGITSTILGFGEKGECRGWLVGEPHHGLKYMFHMMNEARIGVGLSAAALAYAGYRYSLDYAKTRLQGRPVDGKDPATPMVPIADHPDVRHLLLRQKCYAEGGLALALDCAAFCDDAEVADDDTVRADAALLLDLLTPIAKAWPSAYCLESNSLAIQVLGGYGYTRDYPVEQYYRDNRLNPIHEGTNGIQGLDLLGRKVSAGNGRALQLLCDRIAATVAEAKGVTGFELMASQLERACARVVDVTGQLLQRAGDPKAMLCDSSEYLAMFGHVVVAWLWLRQALAAERALQAGAGVREGYLRGKLDACRYFYRWELPRAMSTADILVVPDRTVLELDIEGMHP
ncbi:acyl-CoA dehydrogenase [Luteimonas aestuarii]|uniref:Acyl-CoA dehydrogenase n=1 Tax=Luteimonas aestuarii TaxID=453837 RepID=A0A4R5TYL9_9GAMM|nr:acyl-CoA dehydrogenase [Luteimonas aestuarii]TDK26318.1 acyl-CoA dehydrogenase [Luteimonas aestuarii]